MNTREISLIAIISALYASLVIILAPISFGPIQLRLADCLIPFSALFGWPAVVGVSIGAFAGNAYYFLGVYDVIFGAVANFIAASIIFRLRHVLLAASVFASITIGIIVGGYLWIYFPPPEIAGLSLPFWLAMMLSVTISSIITIPGIGYLLVKAIIASKFLEMIESRGLKRYL